MSGRPEPLWPLFADLTGLDGIGPKSAQALEAAGIETPRDLLFTLPYSGIDRHLKDSVIAAELPGVATVEAMIGNHRVESTIRPAGDGKSRLHVEAFSAEPFGTGESPAVDLEKDVLDRLSIPYTVEGH